jgi:hypothetical protein
MELHNMDGDVLDELYKIASINLSPNTPGQVLIYDAPRFTEFLPQYFKHTNFHITLTPLCPHAVRYP